MSSSQIALPLLLAVMLAGAHLLASKLRFLQGTPRSRWLSLAGGVAVAYVFVHLIPELQAGQETVRETGSLGVAWLEHHVYLMALLGLSVFYGLERAAKTDRSQRRGSGGEDQTGSTVFWIHMASYAVYNALIGYLLIHREEPGWRSLLFFWAAMTFHFITNDFGLRQDHQEPYDRVGRWILAAAVIVGWGIGTVIEIDKAALALLFAFLGGGIILNVMKEELPEERQSNYGAFAAGVTGYAALLLLI